MRTLARKQDRDELLRRLSHVRPDSDRVWGRMTAHQMVCHLADAFDMALGERPVTGASHLLNQTVVKWVALYLPLRWPPGITTSPELDAERSGTKPGTFAADVARVEALLKRVAAPSGRDGVAHPVFGGLTRAAWLRWGYLHMDHHLRQFGA